MKKLLQLSFLLIAPTLIYAQNYISYNHTITVANGKSVSVSNRGVFHIWVNSWAIEENKQYKSFVRFSRDKPYLDGATTRWEAAIYSIKKRNDGSVEYWTKNHGQTVLYLLDMNAVKRNMTEVRYSNNKVVKKTIYYLV